MNDLELKFIKDCPAWARKLGVDNLRIWKIIASVMPLDKSQRFDYVQSLQHAEDILNVITLDESHLILQVVGTWDEMAGRGL